jgi:hypothetical protein
MTPSNSARGTSGLQLLIFPKRPSAPHENVSPIQQWNMSQLTSSPRRQIGHANSIFVFEANTLQALPSELRAVAITKVPDFVAPGGHLLVIARGREPFEPEGEAPWPLIRAEFSALPRAGLTEISFEDFLDQETPPVRRFRALYKRS